MGDTRRHGKTAPSRMAIRIEARIRVHEHALGIMETTLIRMTIAATGLSDTGEMRNIRPFGGF